MMNQEAIDRQIEELKEFKEVALKAEDLQGKGHNVTNMVDNAIQTISDLTMKPKVNWDAMIEEIRRRSIGVGDYHGDGAYEYAIETEEVINIISKYRIE